MDEMKYETEHMNEMMNRNYDCEIDENELDEEMRGKIINLKSRI